HLRTLRSITVQDR
nr:immunoglobulin heavy chain junction region [Mus musculus]